MPPGSKLPLTCGMHRKQPALARVRALQLLALPMRRREEEEEGGPKVEAELRQAPPQQLQLEGEGEQLQPRRALRASSNFWWMVGCWSVISGMSIRRRGALDFTTVVS